MVVLYDAGSWGLLFIFKIHGSVLPKALVVAIPCAAVALALQTAFNAGTISPMITDDEKSSAISLMNGYNLEKPVGAAREALFFLKSELLF